MKPLKLTIEGINSFIEPVSVDFEKLQESGIFCICGPTGSGKTTILDSVILALYAPKSNNRGSLRDYVNTKCETGKVVLVFEADGEAYEVSRLFRKKESASSKAKLIELRTQEVLADKPEDVNDKIKDMLKLEKDEFTRVAVLEQGKFAEFMNAKKSERCRIVAKLFSLDRFDALKERAAKAKNKYEKLFGETEAALRQYEGVTEAELTARKKERKQAEKEIAELEKAHKAAEERARAALQNKTLYEQKKGAEQALSEANETLRTADNEKGNLQARQAAYQKRKEELAKITAQKDGANAVLLALDECRRDEDEKKKREEKRQKLIESYKQADELLRALDAQKKALDAQKEENASKVAGSMRVVVAAGYECDGTAESFAAVLTRATQDEQARRDWLKKKADAEKALVAVQALGEKLIAAEGAYREEIEKAEKAEKGTQTAMEIAQKENAAAAVRQLLKEGDTCPVCGGRYDGTHSAEADSSALVSSQKALEEARARTEKARANLKDIEREQAVRAAREQAAKKDFDEAQKALAKLAAGSAEAVQSAKIGGEAARKIADAEKQTETLALKTDAARKEKDEAEKEGKEVRAQIDDLQARIAARLGGGTFTDAEKKAKETLRACEKAEEEERALREALQKDEQKLLVKIAAATEKKKNAESTCAQLKDVQLDEAEMQNAEQAKKELTDRLNAAHAMLGSAENALKDLTERLAQKKELQKKKSEIDEKLSLVTALNKCVERDNPLLSYVAESYVQSFTAAASDTLSSLTSGKYTLFYDDGDFYVADFFCDNALRKVKTLSGGETFLASVSIAMAVSREIAEKDFGFFFLDEGFGTLHEKALATVTDALYKLSRDTTVGIVTHRGELAERIPTRLNVLPATEEKGSQIVFAAE